MLKFFKFDQIPLTISVWNGRWDAFGPATARSKRLYKRLESKGGINESVPNGVYHYNVKLERGKLIESLLPIED